MGLDLFRIQIGQAGLSHCGVRSIENIVMGRKILFQRKVDKSHS